MSKGQVAEWRLSTISKHARITTGSKDTQNKVENGKHPFFVRSQKVERIDSYAFDGEGVLTAGDGVGTGKVFHYICGKFDYHQRVYLISGFDDNLDGKFFYYYFSENFLKQVQKLSAKGSVDSVRMEMISEMPLPLPPLPEQQKIAAILSSVDDVIEKTRTQIDKLKDLKTGLMQELLTKGIGHTEFKNSPVGRIPKQWTVVRIGDITVEHKQGYYSKEKYSERGTYVVRITDMSNPKISFADMPRMEISDADKEAYKISKGDFLFARSGAIGRYGIYESEDEAVFASYIIRFRFSTELCTNRFIGYCYESDICQDQLSSITQGSSNININAQNIKDILVPLPSVQEQKEIATRIESIDNNIEVLNSRYQKFKCIKAALMQDLLTGKVRVKIDQKESAVA